MWKYVNQAQLKSFLFVDYVPHTDSSSSAHWVAFINHLWMWPNKRRFSSRSPEEFISSSMEINELSVHLHLISQAELFTIKISQDKEFWSTYLLTWAISLMRLHFLKRYVTGLMLMPLRVIFIMTGSISKLMAYTARNFTNDSK